MKSPHAGALVVIVSIATAAASPAGGSLDRQIDVLSGTGWGLSDLVSNSALPINTPATWYHGNQVSIKLDFDATSRNRDERILGSQFNDHCAAVSSSASALDRPQNHDASYR